jgi:protein-disulfide isomerase
VPVTALALPCYAGLAVLAFRARASITAAAAQRVWRLALPLAVVILGAAVWFVGLQTFSLHSFCRLCLLTHSAGVVGAVTLLLRAPWPSLTGVLAPGLAFGVAALGLLVGGQLATPEKSGAVHSVVGMTNSPVVKAPAVPAAPAATVPVAAAAAPPAVLTPVPTNTRPFLVHARFTLDLLEVPVLGATTNPRVAVSLFDYTCHHCRLMHPRLLAVQRAFSNELVMASIPMPLDPTCNRTVKTTPPEHAQACQYARLGLAVWRADREKHAAFEEWLFAGERPPEVAATEAFAAGLIGSNRLAAARSDPWIEKQIDLSVGIYELAYRAQHGSMPQLIVGSTVAEGAFSQEDLFKLFATHLGLTNAP